MRFIFGSIARFFTQIALDHGVFGLGFGMFAESIGIPCASAVLELTSGLLISEGKTTFLEALIISTTGLTLGSVVSYFLGYFSAETIGKFSKPRERYAKHKRRLVRDFLVKHGDISIFFAQLFGTTRTWVSLPAGAMKIDLKKFTLYTAIGGAVYCSIAIGLSVFLTRLLRKFYHELFHFVNITFWASLTITAILAFIIYKLVRTKRKNQSAKLTIDKNFKENIFK